jgi:hypothetical protein
MNTSYPYRSSNEINACYKIRQSVSKGPRKGCAFSRTGRAGVRDGDRNFGGVAIVARKREIGVWEERKGVSDKRFFQHGTIQARGKKMKENDEEGRAGWHQY